MRPVDPRLARRARALRPYLLGTGCLAAANAGLVIAFATLLAEVIAGAVTSHAAPAHYLRDLVLLAVVAALRGVLTGAQEIAGARAAASVKGQLRADVAERIAEPGAVTRPAGEVAVLFGPGLDGLDTYLARYLPALVLATVVPPLVLARLVLSDRMAALIVVGTLPLIPLFLALVGLATQRLSTRQVVLLTKLGAHFLDVMRGLPTLRVFRRARAQSRTIAAAAEDQRVATMRALRLAFLCSLVLELIATLSVALIAVSVGLRLADGKLSFRTALLVLILAPEAYLPLRRLGAQHHAAADGLAAAAAVLDLLDEPRPARGGRVPAPDPARLPVRVESLTVRHPDRELPAPQGLSLHIGAGEMLAVVGRNGTGKSTLLRVLAGLHRPDTGRVLVGGVDLADLAPEAWHRRIAYVPQQPHLFAGTIADNIRLGDPAADDAAVARAAELAAVDEIVAELPAGLRTAIGDGGLGLSAGQCRRIALARAFLRREAGLILLDEPTADLDLATESRVAAAIRTLAGDHTVVVVTHRTPLAALADRVVTLHGAVPADPIAELRR